MVIVPAAVVAVVGIGRGRAEIAYGYVRAIAAKLVPNSLATKQRSKEKMEDPGWTYLLLEQTSLVKRPPSSSSSSVGVTSGSSGGSGIEHHLKIVNLGRIKVHPSATGCAAGGGGSCCTRDRHPSRPSPTVTPAPFPVIQVRQIKFHPPSPSGAVLGSLADAVGGRGRVEIGEREEIKRKLISLPLPLALGRGRRRGRV